MSKNGNRYSDEFKQQIIDLYNAEKQVLELSGEYGVATVVIYKWFKNLSPIEISDNEIITTKEWRMKY
jgi:transposase